MIKIKEQKKIVKKTKGWAQGPFNTHAGGVACKIGAIVSNESGAQPLEPNKQKRQQKT